MTAKLQLSAKTPTSVLYSDDVFSAYTYTGNGSTQTITNGIDLAGNGGLVWIKNRTNAGTNPTIADTAQGTGKLLYTNVTNAAFNSSAVSAFNSNGFSLPNAADTNQSGQAHVSWTFRKAPKFFDVVTYTGNGSNRTIPHSLGQSVGMMIVKNTTSASSWVVWNNALTGNQFLLLDSTAAVSTAATVWNSTTPTASVFSIGTDSSVNTNGSTYVAYLFAHDAAADGLIQCGGYTGNGSASGVTINLGWEPQFVLVKNAGAANDWVILDSQRGVPVDGSSNIAKLAANLSAAEVGTSDALRFNATGFVSATTSSITNGNGNTYIYLAIRRPNKPPTTGTQVYNAIARTGTGAAATVTGVGFAPDVLLSQSRNNAITGAFYDRLRGAGKDLLTSATNAEGTNADAVTSYNMDGVSFGADSTGWYVNKSTYTYINWFFRRAPGVFDVVAWTGNATYAARSHSLGVVPELCIQKSRSGVSDWPVWLPPSTNILLLNTTAAYSANGSSPATSTTFTPIIDASSTTYITYLFATKAGISKVGSFVNSGAAVNVDCGFTTGARFILAKNSTAVGDWFVWDTTRGIVAANDPSLKLNSTAAEASFDDIDPLTSGFIFNGANFTTGTWIYLAIA